MKKLLIVEDHADIRQLLRMALEFEDYEIHERSAGRPGLDAALELRPDVVLLDLMMAGELDGLEVCTRLRQAPVLAHTRIVMLSARGTAADRRSGLDAGADAYLVKPFSPQAVIDTLLALNVSTAVV